MAFPATPLGVTVELLVGGTWTDLTAAGYIREHEPLTITRGRADEATEVDRSVCRLQATNRSGNLSPRNPVGAFYGQIGRNTPLRVRLEPSSDAYLLSASRAVSSGPFTVDTANLSITGDIDLRAEVQRDTWDAQVVVASKYSGTTQRSWVLYINADDTLSLAWSADGSTMITKTSTAAVSVPSTGRLAIRATLDVDNGAAGNDVRFYTSASLAASFTQLGATVTTAGVTSIFDSTSGVGIGQNQTLSTTVGALLGRIYGFEVYQGIDGTIRSEVDFDDTTPGAATFTDSQGATWFLVDHAHTSIVDPAVRFHGEVSEWPQQWDSSQDVTVPLEASGVLRRLGQGAAALKSTLYRGLTTMANQPKAYWPCEDGTDATEIASGIGGPPMRFVFGAPTLSANTEFACSAALPTFSGSQWQGSIPTYTGTGNIQVWFLFKAPTGAATQTLFLLYTTGTARRWDVAYIAGAGGDFRVRASDGDGNLIVDTTLDFNIENKLLRVGFRLQQNGANIDWDIETLEVGASAVGGNGATLNSFTVSAATKLWMNHGGTGTDTVIGHIAVHDAIFSLFTLAAELNAYTGETAGRRIQRLCGEESVTFRAAGDLDASSKMGAQAPAELVTLLRDAANADGGILYEPRDMFGLAYRPRSSMYRQAAALALDYLTTPLAALEPTDDDQHTRNDITVQRPGGSSSRAIEATGPLSIQAPPAGVGRYDEAVTLNLQADDQLADVAGWRLHLGTVDEARYPTIGIDLAHRVYTTNQTLTLVVQDLDIGDRVTISGPPPWLPPDAITQLAQGFTERMGAVVHRIDVNCAPESPWGMVGTYDGAGLTAARYSSDGSTLSSGITSTATSLSVATPTGPLWTIADGSFDIRVGGEVMRVTNITGSSSPQTFTVTRSINGVTKAHSSGAVLELAVPAVYAP